MSIMTATSGGPLEQAIRTYEMGASAREEVAPESEECQRMLARGDRVHDEIIAAEQEVLALASLVMDIPSSQVSRLIDARRIYAMQKAFKDLVGDLIAIEDKGDAL